MVARDLLGKHNTMQYSKGAHLTAGGEYISFPDRLCCLLESAGVEFILQYSLQAGKGRGWVRGGVRGGLLGLPACILLVCIYQVWWGSWPRAAQWSPSPRRG